MLGADLALLGALGWVGRGIWLCWASWAGLDLVLGFGSGALGWVGRGFGFLCMVYIVHVFFMSSWCLCVYFHVNLRCVSWGLSKTKPVIGEWNVVLSNSVFEKCDVKPTKWKQKVGNGSGEKGQHRQQCSSSTTTWQFQHNNTSWKWTASSQCNIEIADFVAEIEPNVRFCVEQN